MTIWNLILGFSFCFVVLKVMGLITLSWWLLPLIWAFLYKLLMRAVFGSLFLTYLTTDDIKLRNEIGKKLEYYVLSRTGVKVNFTVEEKTVTYEDEEDE